jgi:hypothetical protein
MSAEVFNPLVALAAVDGGLWSSFVVGTQPA